MAVLFTASPNPVPFTLAEVNAKVHHQVTLAWGTGSTDLKARIYRSANNQGETVLGGNNVPFASTGTLTDQLGYSDTVVYALRDTTTKPLQKITVSTALFLPPPPPPPATPSQLIYDVRMTPRGDGIWLRFKTLLPSSPWVELIDPETGAMAGYWARPQVRTSHAMMFRGLGVAFKQSHEYRFAIVADRTASVDATTNPKLSGRVVTGSRSVEVIFAGVNLANNRAYASTGNDYHFYGTAGDLATGLPAGHRTLADPLPHGGSVFVDERLSVPSCGPRAWLSVVAQWWTPSGFWAHFHTDMTEEPSAAPKPGLDRYVRDDETVDQVTEHIALHPGWTTGPNWAPVLPTDSTIRVSVADADFDQPWAVDVLFKVHLDDGRWNFEGWSADRMRFYRFAHPFARPLRPGVFTELGRGAPTRSGSLTPDGKVLIADAAEDGSALILPGSVRSAVAAAVGDRIVLAAVDSDRRVQWTTISDHDRNLADWQDLELDNAVEVSLIGDVKHVEVLALTRPGDLYGRDPHAHAGWLRLASEVSHFAAVPPVHSGGAGVVTIDAHGQVSLLDVDSRDVRSTDLGRTDPGPLSAGREKDGSVTVLVVGVHNSVTALSVPASPGAGFVAEWSELCRLGDMLAGASSTVGEDAVPTLNNDSRRSEQTAAAAEE